MLQGLIILLLFIAACVIGLPVGFAIGFTTWFSFLMLDGKMLVLAQKLFTSVNSFTYLCIPLFILAAEIMSEGKLIDKIVDFFQVCIGHIRGGLAYVNVLDSMVFAGISGSASADMASIGVITSNAMIKAGYTKDYAVTVSAATATIAPLIPPSTIMIIFAAAAGRVSVGELFAGGTIPGILYGCAFLVLCWYFAKKYNQPKNERRATFKEIWTEFKLSLPVILLPLLILGSIVSGICTATEAGALAVIYSIVVTLMRKTMTLHMLYDSLYESARLTASVLFIIATAGAMQWVLTALQIPQHLAEFCLQFIESKFVFLLFVNILLFFVGCLLDGAPAVLLLTPILFPVAMTYGIDPVHFGIVMCLNLTIGLITPPIGMVLFVASNVTSVKLSVLYKTVWPFVLTGVVVLLLVTYCPILTTWLPSMMG